MCLLLVPTYFPHEFSHPLRCQHSFEKRVGHEIVELRHRQDIALAPDGTHTRMPATGVVSITPALTSAKRHRRAARSTFDQPLKKNGIGDSPRGVLPWITVGKAFLHSLEGSAINQRGARKPNPLVARLLHFAFAVFAIEVVRADIGSISQNLMHELDIERLSIALPPGSPVQISGRCELASEKSKRAGKAFFEMRETQCLARSR